MLDILSYLPSKRKKSSNGWISFNAVCCTHNGESQDKRSRGGILLSNENDWSYHCFNCNFKTGFTLGKPVGIKARRLLSWLGISKVDIDWLNIESLRHKSITDILDDRNKVISAKIKFSDVDLPATARFITTADTKFIKYLENRGMEFDQYSFMISPTDKNIRNKERIIVPYTNKGQLVGYTSRFLDDRKPKYLNEQQPGYVFGLDLQKDNWEFAIVVEGVFDAISIDGLAVLHNEISNTQSQQIKQLYREVIVVPDQDRSGVKLVDKALEHGFNVSIPKWGDNIKDVNDAVVKYGKVGTLLKILEYKNSSTIKIKLAKKELERKVERIQ